MTYHYDDINENADDFVAPYIQVKFEWVDSDGVVIVDSGTYTQGGASTQPGIGWFLQDAITGTYVINAPVTAELPYVTMVAPAKGDKRAAGLKQTVTVNAGTVTLSADAGILSGMIWLGGAV